MFPVQNSLNQEDHHCCCFSTLLSDMSLGRFMKTRLGLKINWTRQPIYADDVNLLRDNINATKKNRMTDTGLKANIGSKVYVDVPSPESMVCSQHYVANRSFEDVA
jgi:hypothetical protein